MNLDDAKLTLSRISYKKNFRLEIWPVYGAAGEAVLKLSHDFVEDSTNLTNQMRPTKVVQIGIGKMTDSDLVHRVFAEILAWEQHEACEFFRFEGVQIFSPHANVHILREALS